MSSNSILNCSHMYKSKISKTKKIRILQYFNLSQYLILSFSENPTKIVAIFSLVNL